MLSEVSLTVAGSAMAVLLAQPEGAGPFPAVLVTHHREGIDDFTRGVVRRLAQNGFIAAAPNFYHRRPAGEDTKVSRTHLDDSEVVADIEAGVTFLRSTSSVRADAIAVAGHCMGGRIAFLGAAANPVFKAAAIFYGGGIFRAEGTERAAPFAYAGDIRCPVLGSFGREDKNPSPDDVGRLAAEFDRLGIRHDFRIYDGAGHAFQNFSNPASYREAVSEAAWARFLTFLRTEL